MLTEWLGLGISAVLMVGGGIALWTKVNSQIAVLQDRSDHPPSGAEKDDDKEDIVDELRRQARRNEARIGDLEQALDRERTDRERERRDYQQQISDLTRRVSELSTALARQNKEPQ